MWFVLACSHPTSVTAAPERRTDPSAVSFALRALRAEALGDVGESERAWRWVARLDAGVEARIHRAASLDRQGLDGSPSWAEAVALSPLDARARLGLALSTGSALPDGASPCLVAGSDHPKRADAEAACAP